MRGVRALVVAVLGAALVIAGCGSDGGDSTNATNAESPASTLPAAPPSSPAPTSASATTTTPTTVDLDDPFQAAGLCSLLDADGARAFMGEDVVATTDGIRCVVELTDSGGGVQTFTLRRFPVSRDTYDDTGRNRNDPEDLSGIGDSARYTADTNIVEFYQDDAQYQLVYETESGTAPTAADIKDFLVAQAEHVSGAI